MDNREELLKQVNKLLSALTQMMKSGEQTTPLSWVENDGKNVTLNICFCSFLSGDDEDYEAWESMVDDLSLAGDVSGGRTEEKALTFELTKRDRDFLNANGISF